MQSGGGCWERGRESKASQQAAPAAAPCPWWHFPGRQSKRHGEVDDFPPPAMGAAQRGAVRWLGTQLLPPQAASDRKMQEGQRKVSLAVQKMQMHSKVLVDQMSGALKPFGGCQLLSCSKAIPSPEPLCFLMHIDQSHATKKPSASCMGKERILLQREGMAAGPQGASRPLQPALPRSCTSGGMHSKAEVSTEKRREQESHRGNLWRRREYRIGR